MIDAARDYLSGIATLAESFQRLHEVNPTHPYLHFAEFREDKQVIIQEEFLRGFEPRGTINPKTNGVQYLSQTFLNANLALDDAIRHSDRSVA